MRLMALPLLALVVTASASPMLVLDVEVQGLRNARGQIHASLTRNRAHFPDCSKDPEAIKRTTPASKPQLRFTGFPPGDYALTVLHDENANDRMDKVLGVPKEGFGFSRSPVVRFGPPRFEQVRIALAKASTSVTVRIQYVL